MAPLCGPAHAKINATALITGVAKKTTARLWQHGLSIHVCIYNCLKSLWMHTIYTVEWSRLDPANTWSVHPYNPFTIKENKLFVYTPHV